MAFIVFIEMALFHFVEQFVRLSFVRGMVVSVVSVVAVVAVADAVGQSHLFNEPTRVLILIKMSSECVRHSVLAFQKQILSSAENC